MYHHLYLLFHRFLRNTIQVFSKYPINLLVSFSNSSLNSVSCNIFSGMIVSNNALSSGKLYLNICPLPRTKNTGCILINLSSCLI